MTDIIERLMRFAGKVCLSTDTEIEAAAEIERLRAELATAWKEAEEQNEAVCEVLRKIGDMRAENEKLRAALKDCASDLEAEIRGRYTGGGGWDIHPSLVKKFERDMSTVRAAAAALKETGDE